ncbi:MAG: hypothetical protein ACRC8E_15010, partial [Plesiomonas shigelloides]
NDAPLTISCINTPLRPILIVKQTAHTGLFLVILFKDKTRLITYTAHIIPARRFTENNPIHNGVYYAPFA